MDIAQTARKALEILDEDGWCKGSVNFHPMPPGITISAIGVSPFSSAGFPAGSHCLGGAWNLACHGDLGFHLDSPESYEPLTEVILAQYPEIAELGFTDSPEIIVNFNDRADTAESDVRAILEKLAAS